MMDATTRVAGRWPLAVAMAAFVLASAVAPAEPAQAAADGCQPGVASDFNGDGWSDIAVADQLATVEGQPEAGVVTVSYGISPVVGKGWVDTITEVELPTADGASAGDRFGSTLASADIDCDGYSDLLVGIPSEDIDGRADAGAVHIVFGGFDGLSGGADERLLISSFTATAPAAGDRFGHALDVMEDIGQHGAAAPVAYALAIGVPGRDVGGDADAGAVAVRAPSPSGSSDQLLMSDSPGVPGAAEPGDQFGTAVTLGRLTGAADVVDVVVGTPFEDIGTIKDGGDITVLGDVGASSANAFRSEQGSGGVPGSVTTGDHVGFSLDAALVGAKWRLAVGAPHEDIGKDADAGAVQIYHSNGGTLTPGVSLSQDTPGVNGSTEPGDQFGHAVAWVPPSASDVRARLAIAVPTEDGPAADTGLVQVIPIFVTADDVVYSQSSPGVLGAAEVGDGFGAAISVVTTPDEQVLLVGCPGDVGFLDGIVAMIPLDGTGPPRSLAPGYYGATAFGSGLATDGR